MESEVMVNDCIDYIEENVAEKLSLELFASNFYISKYHFHRIFLASMGDSIMSYIRRRRVIRASHEIMYSDKDITYIALNFGFNSLDVFSRAFKKLYGIPPNEYRKIKKCSKGNHTQKGEDYMNKLNINERIKCNSNEKRECLNTLGMILEASKKAHKKGLLALEEDTNAISNKFFKKGLELVLYGMEPLVIREVLENYIIVGDYKGKELLERVLMLEGILSIQQGDYPWVIREKLCSYFGAFYWYERSEW
ncbi:MAG: helix-turn-helix domain-containing protein [Firmicutes bacterium]|nr:helix-turn-helix domain-containing protein [Bacillota bacterium]